MDGESKRFGAVGGKSVLKGQLARGASRVAVARAGNASPKRMEGDGGREPGSPASRNPEPRGAKPACGWREHHPSWIADRLCLHATSSRNAARDGDCAIAPPQCQQCGFAEN